MTAERQRWASNVKEAVDIPMRIGDSPPVTVFEVLRKAASEFGHQNAFNVRRRGEWLAWTWKEVHECVNKASKAFLRLGLEPFEAVVIVGFNSPEWIIAYLGAMLAGGIPVGLHPACRPGYVRQVFKHSNASMLVVDSDDQWVHLVTGGSPSSAAVGASSSSAGVAGGSGAGAEGKQPKKPLAIKAVVQWLGLGGVSAASEPDVPLLSWDHFLSYGKDLREIDVRMRSGELQPGNCAAIIYDSATLKAVMLSHDNFTWVSKQVALKAVKLCAADRIVSYMPLCYVAPQLVDIHCAMACGASVYFAFPDAFGGSLVDTLEEVSPTVLLAVPRVLEALRRNLLLHETSRSWMRRRVGAWARRTLLAGNLGEIQGRPKPFSFWLAKLLVAKRYRRVLGLQRCRLVCNIAAPLEDDLLSFFLSVNVPLSCAFGATECSGPATVPSLALNAGRHLGRPLVNGDFKVADKSKGGSGEVRVRGRHLFMGYLKSPKDTAAATDSEGYLRTGEIGKLDADENLTLNGRIKEVLVTSSGESVAPVPIEAAIAKELPVVQHALVIGSGRPFLTCLLTLRTTTDATGNPCDDLHPDVVAQFKSLRIRVSSVTEAISSPKVWAHIDAGIAAANQRSFLRTQTVKKWTLLPRGLAPSELISETRVKRLAVEQRHKNVIDEMYFF